MPTVDQLRAEYQQSPGYGKQSPDGFVEYLVDRINALEAAGNYRGLVELFIDEQERLGNIITREGVTAGLLRKFAVWTEGKPAPQITACPWCGHEINKSEKGKRYG